MRISDWSSDVCSSDLVTLHQAVDADGPGGSTWKVFARPARKLGLGDTIDFGGGFTAEVVGKGEAGEVTLTFDRRGGALLAALEEHGIMPLPPYIQRDKTGDSRDRSDYQTVVARRARAVAAPTARPPPPDRLRQRPSNGRRSVRADGG